VLITMVSDARGSAVTFLTVTRAASGTGFTGAGAGCADVAAAL
jgi:hypothetical protein